MTKSVASPESTTPASMDAPRWTLVASFGTIGIGTLVLIGWAFLATPPEPTLGVFDDVVYTTSKCALFAGDLLLLYTDGLTEVSNAAGEE